MRRILGKFVVLVIGISLAALLCGFCSVHDWVPATCEEPETCSICGSSRGEPLEYQWGELKKDLFEICIISSRLKSQIGTAGVSLAILFVNVDLAAMDDTIAQRLGEPVDFGLANVTLMKEVFGI